MRIQLQLVLLATVHLIVQLSAQTRELQEIAIESAAAKSWYRDKVPANAHDGNYNTYYSVKDGDTSGNFLKLYLPQRYSIDHVKVTNRLDHCCQERITGTTVKVYSVALGEAEVVSNCGTIRDWDSHNLHDKDAQTYTLNCNGAVGDMIYITDTVIEGYDWPNGAIGHGISEVLVMGSIAENFILRATCDNVLTIFVDGVSQQLDGLDKWTVESTVSVPDNFKVIAMKCVDHGSQEGILASVENTSGEAVLLTDSSWKCSTEFEEGWEQIDFSATSRNWQPASEKGIHGMKPWSNIGQISHSAQWIWANNYAVIEVYCRGVYNSGYNVLTISSAEMKNNWSEYPPRNLIDGNLNNFAHSFSKRDGMWIRVHLAEHSSVARVEVYNRLDCCKDRIVGLLVYIKSGEEYVTTCGTISGVHNSYTFNCIGIGDVVELSKEGQVGQQNIAEIKVYGRASSEREREEQLVPGQKGEQGEPGRDGLDGENGPDGDDDYCDPEECPVEGDQGGKGDIGLPGEPGMKGLTGITGSKGILGKGGQPGDRGEKGTSRDEGVTGLTGEPGMMGANGVRVCNTGGCPSKRLRLGRCYARSSIRSSVLCKDGYAAASIWRNTHFFGVKCCRILGTHNV